MLKFEKKRIQKILSNVPFFKNLTEKDINDILAISETKRFSKDEIIFKEQSQGEEMYIIIDGKVEIFRTDNDGKDIEFQRMDKEGEFFGEMSLLDNMPRSASVKCLAETSVLVIKRTPFISHFEKFPKALTKIVQGISKRLRELNEKYIEQLKNKL